MLWMSKDADLGKLTWDKDAKQLKLALPASADALFGEVAQSRFASLARALELEPVATTA